MNPPSSALSWFERILQVIKRDPLDREGILNLLRDAQQRGLFTPDTLGMIEGALQVSEMHVRDIMIPRAQMVTLELSAPTDKLIQTIVESGHSRFPVIGDSRDDVQGIFLAKDLLDYYANGTVEHFNMREAMRPAIFIPESKRLNVLLRDFRSSRNHIAIVVDEYGGVAGLVTIEDVIEQIVGDIDDEHDFDDQIFIKQRGDNLYSVLALTPIEEFNEFFKTDFSDEEFDTVGGLILQAFGHMPKRGESLQLAGFYFEVIRSNSRRIHLLRVKPLQE
ncbi:HlyC/CorC family transporter [Thioflexithrix psekupsensis]|uniref:Magnesium and cobalt efflux protein CorC n=1 Tax=Thioflexithrix psekupsensis TaxID=1570016 RepID=A0A251X859_9GAMM|nr:transporter associated domain-containing protein [Thioflexithrix psekupsensis]OUD13917.1 magnesium/cobalt efflux protein [Thioflexithrix psekupsensis]